MLEFIQLLKQRYQAILVQRHNGPTHLQYQQRIDQLLLSEAFIRKGQTIDLMAGLKASVPLQIAVVGPTQAGKSSLVNVLLNSNAAGVSPLAGYTVHPQGFCHCVSLNACGDLQRYFGRFQCLPAGQLTKGRYDCYSLTEVTGVSPYLPPCVIWDTPDFDSIDSATYREGVIRAVALADMIVLVVSKEKYADQSVWDMMSMLADLHQPTVICLNKLSEGSQAILTQSLREKWQQARTDAFPEVVPLYYQKPAGLPLWPTAKQGLLVDTQNNVDHRNHAGFEQALLQKYWQGWLAPVLEEHQALTDWETLVDEMMGQALASYRRDYLDHPHHYETFQQALAELMVLLEIPGLAGVLTGVRKALTWPVRQLMKLGRKQLHIVDSSHEIVLLNQIVEHALIQTVDRLLDKAEQNKQAIWWKTLSGLLRSQRQAIHQDFALAAKNYHISFQQDVEKTAHHLYDKLQEQPMVLNSLRATRVTADAAVIALTLHTGGIGVHDLVIAPAMLTVTSLLAESSIGGYMHKVEAQLKQRQFNEVKQVLFMDSLAKELLGLPGQIPSISHFNISPEQLRVIGQQEKRYGLRLL
ncbi:MAG: GTPase domain-containing protein [Methylovulum sp.]|nr:GTPase domain-containing protein [Methylovulum sp.]